MDKAVVQELIVLLVTLLLSYLESCYGCTRHTYVDCDPRSPLCEKKGKLKMNYLNEFVLVFIHIAISILNLSQACRHKKHCKDPNCFPCNHFGGPKVRSKLEIKWKKFFGVLFLMLVFVLSSVDSCKRRQNCQKYCLPCKYKGPIIEVLYPKEVSFLVTELQKD
ncbi:unnamed protein product [Danaus chrysippus]|uniref:(African queen) hypothetical protein n=1 Tax=Danaus chrysippus TaxID=151541 RepID=A0A8J2QU06_9NEOP|nr:unnamed protein product [Danaus chrysippus]